MSCIILISQGSTDSPTSNPCRISDGKFTLGDVEYRLRKNDGRNHLHGGVKGFHMANWAVHIENGSNAVTFRLEFMLCS